MKKKCFECDICHKDCWNPTRFKCKKFGPSDFFDGEKNTWHKRTIDICDDCLSTLKELILVNKNKDLY